MTTDTVKKTNQFFLQKAVSLIKIVFQVKFKNKILLKTSKLKLMLFFWNICRLKSFEKLFFFDLNLHVLMNKNSKICWILNELSVPQQSCTTKTFMTQTIFQTEYHLIQVQPPLLLFQISLRKFIRFMYLQTLIISLAESKAIYLITPHTGVRDMLLLFVPISPLLLFLPHSGWTFVAKAQFRNSELAHKSSIKYGTNIKKL